MISKIRAQNIASSWYTGQWSGLYLIVCGRWDKIRQGEYKLAETEALDEGQLQLCLENKRDAKSLFALADFCHAMAYNAKE